MDGLSIKNRARCRGLNIFEFVAILLIIGGLSYGFTRGLDEGLWEATVSALKAGGIAWLAWAALMLAIMAGLWLMLLYRPFYPRCRNGVCGQSKYRVVTTDLAAATELSQEGRSKTGMLVRCGCGDLYLEALTEQRFYAVTPAGELRPYLRYRPFRRWEADPG